MPSFMNVGMGTTLKTNAKPDSKKINRDRFSDVCPHIARVCPFPRYGRSEIPLYDAVHKNDLRGMGCPG